MNIKPLDQITRRILEQYDKSPEGWSVLSDSKGNVIILGPRSRYRLKLIPLSPNEYTGVGVGMEKSERITRMVEGASPFGFRPVSRQEAKELFGAMSQAGRVDRRVIQGLLGRRPISIKEIMEIKPETLLGGPVIAHPDLSSISRRQRELDEKLAREAEKLFRRKYPLRAGIYG